jgi:hypothetical protein
VKNDRSSSPGDSPAGNRWTRFWFTPIPPTGLHGLRVLTGILLLCWLLSFWGHAEAFFGKNGWVDAKAVQDLQAIRSPQVQVMGWSLFHLADSSTAFQAIYFGSLAVIALFTLGIATRWTGVLTWVAVVSFLSSPVTTYEGDFLLGILAFYLMLAYLLLGLWNGNLSGAERILGSHYDNLALRWLFPPAGGARPDSYAANFVLRIMQIHVAIIFVTSGFHKLQSGDWWSGAALWYPLHGPFQTTIESMRREMPNRVINLFVLSVVQYAGLAWQIGFPLFAWRTGWWRAVLLGGAAAYWLGMIFVFHLPIFGPFVCIGCLSFLTPEEWALLRGWFRFTWRASASAPAESKRVPVSSRIQSLKNS